MKKSLLSICFILSVTLGFSQQRANNTLFEWNRIEFNPAFSGASNTTDITVLTRQQWFGFTDAPKTQYVSVHSYLSTGIGIGGVIYNNVAGPTRQTGLKAAFAKHISINKDMKLSMAMSFDIYQNSYDKDKLSTGLPGDPAVENSPMEQKLAPDASFGLVLYTANYFVGLSSTNLTESRYDFLSTKADFSNPIDRAYYLTGAYTFRLNKEFKYSPGLLVKKSIGLPFEIDFTNRFNYKGLITGLSYRSSNDLSIILGVQFAKFYEFVYAYDYSFNPLGNYSSGSHELVLRFKLDNYNRENGRGRRKASFEWS